MELGEPAQVETAASVFRELCYNYRDQLLAGIICAGWDRKKGGQVRPVSRVFHAPGRPLMFCGRGGQ